jgi:hypothetical protein
MMAKKTKIEAVTSWSEVEKCVIAALNIDDPGVRYAVKRWRDDVKEIRDADVGGEPVHPFASPNVIEAAITFFRADIIENEAIYRLKVAKSNRQLALMHLHAALAGR